MPSALVPPAAQRNLQPILEVLRSALPQQGRFLEIASGSGFHIVNFAAAFPQAMWQPSDPDAGARGSIAAHRDAANRENLLPPVELNVERRPWPVSAADAVLCINMIHISPWTATEALFAGAAEVLPVNGVLFTYGPYIVDGDFIADSNIEFDKSLRTKNPTWGLRELNDVDAVASANGFVRAAKVAMPANNFALVFRKRR